MEPRKLKDVLIAFSPLILISLAVLIVGYIYVDPAPPKHIIISTGNGEGGYQDFAKLYQDIIKEDGVTLEIRPSRGPWENMRRLADPNSDIDAGFVIDGLGNPEKTPDVSSLGGLYYEPIWIFYRGKKEITRFSQFSGKRISIGEKGTGTHTLGRRILKASGIDAKKAKITDLDPQEEVAALRAGKLDAAFFLGAPDEPLIEGLIKDKTLKLMSVDQAEAITRHFPYLHHLVLPHGAIDLATNAPEKDTDLVSPTANLFVRDSLHSALVYLLLKAAAEVHSDRGIFEKKNEFPIDKDYQFPLADEAKAFYKSGTPFWHRYLPFWLASLVERFIVLAIPAMALVIPVFRMVPKILAWRRKSRFYQRYGELKFLEVQIENDLNRDNYKKYAQQLDNIEERVNRMKVPLDFSDQIYGLRGHIHFVRERLARLVKMENSSS